MKYEIRVNGTFSGIKLIFTNQIYVVNIKCPTCRKERENIHLNVNNINYNIKNEKVNEVIRCTDCKSELTFKIMNPKNKIKIDENEYFYEKVDNYYVVSIIKTNAEILSLKLFDLNVVSSNEYIFMDCDMKDKVWNGVDKFTGDLSVIEDFYYELIRIK